MSSPPKEKPPITQIPQKKIHRLARIHADWGENAESTEEPQKTPIFA